jgi:tRNA A-37 threonylcarbamoyl transferase component Bud32
MPDYDADSFAERAVLIGLMTQGQLLEAREDASDGTLEELTRTLVRKQSLTSWQVDRLLKGKTSGFYFGGAKVMFHIAEGTFARVYRGRRQPGNLSVAIKVLRHRFTSDPASIQRFNQEAESGMRLAHPNIVRIYDHGEEDRLYYMTMEFVEGSNLRDFLRIRGKLQPHEALPMMIGLGKGLAHALEKGVTHRDLKGTNVLVSTTGEAKLVDFGLATLRGDDKTAVAAHGQRTVDYSALERTCGSAKGDPRSDIYFLGCVFYHMLSGKVPMPEAESKDPLAKMLRRSFGAIKPLGELASPPPEELTAIVERMMKIDLKARYQRVEDVIGDLESFQAKLDVPAPPPRPMRPRPVIQAEDQSEGEGGGLAPYEIQAVEQPTQVVLFVEHQADVQDVFRKTFSKLGYRVILVGDAERGAERFRERPPDAVVFDADGQGEEGFQAFLDMHDKAHEDDHELAAVVIVGPRQRSLLERLPKNDRLIVLVKPIKIKDVQDALAQLAPMGTPTPGPTANA